MGWAEWDGGSLLLPDVHLETPFVEPKHQRVREAAAWLRRAGRAAFEALIRHERRRGGARVTARESVIRRAGHSVFRLHRRRSLRARVASVSPRAAKVSFIHHHTEKKKVKVGFLVFITVVNSKQNWEVRNVKPRHPEL